MKKQSALAWGAFTLFSLAYAASDSDWGEYKPFKGSYLMYSNTLGEQQPPTPHERKISFMVTGTVAKDMFDSMAPDSTERCSLQKGYRQRDKENVSCVRDHDGYSCHFGFNLRSGKSIAGSIC